MACSSVQSQKDYWPLQPIWNAEKISGESLLFIQDGDSTPEAKLLFDAKDVLRVYSPSTGIVYKQGRDYQCQPGSRIVCLTKNSRIPFRHKSEMYPKPGSQRSIKSCRNSDNDLYFGEGHLFHDQQVEIDYTHDVDSWTGYKPEYRLSDLPNIESKLNKCQNVKVVIYGDSISTGANASAKVNAKPFMPSYGNLVGWSLEEIYGCSISIYNLSKGGQVSKYGVINASKVIEKKPDLVIIGWGMNDGSRRVTPEEYGNNIKQQIDEIRSAFPKCEFILVSTMYGNPEWTKSAPDLYPLYRDQLKQLCGKGIILADVTSVFAEVLKKKRFCDITGNGVNHPNDFGHRLYAQTILSLLVKDTSKLDKAVRKVRCPDRSEYSNLHSRQLIKDRSFKNGFKVLSPKHGEKVVIGELNPIDRQDPIWMLAQWHSKYNILEGKTEKVSDSKYRFYNEAKEVTLGLHDADMTFYVDGVTEYDNLYRKSGEPWPHLLCEQAITNCPRLSELRGLDFSVSARLLQSETVKKEGYSTELHTAHVPFVMVLQNRNTESAGHGDMIWFLVMFYDERYPFPKGPQVRFLSLSHKTGYAYNF